MSQSMSHKGDSLGDRMKMYEGVEAQRRVMPLVPAMARLDGRAFHTFTRGMNRPYDERFSQLMINTTKFLVEQTGAVCGYTQSDEITLTWLQSHVQTDIFFAGRIQKMVSNLAALATAYFNLHKNEAFQDPAAHGLHVDFTGTEPQHVFDSMPLFDCRVWSVPNAIEGANCFVWREWDATKNSISMAAQAHFSHNRLQGLHAGDMHELLFQEKGVNWNDYPAFFKRGTYIRRSKVTRPFTTEELSKLPPKHNAHKNPNLMVERNVIEIMDMPPINTVTNREYVIYLGADPKVLGDVGR